MAIAQKFFEKGMPIVGVPKTIDNDLLATDITFGFRTAVSIAMEALDRLHTTAESHNRTMVLEVMGRDAGWIALDAGIAGGADLILMPEIPYDLDGAFKHIKRRYARGSKFSIAVVAEQAQPENPEEVGFELRRKNDTCGSWFADQVEETLGFETRNIVLGHIQRGGSPVSFDRVLGSRFGVYAAHMVAQKKFGRMAVLQGRDLNDVSLEETAGKQKLVDPEAELIKTAESLGIFCGRPLEYS
jgi:6-phosphofructokinase 1